uniref:Uncharacterized protein n=1 Tax=Anguilla anguilla TaxID=7936 RepID=A0A0E9V3J6_ANGAN
MTLYSIHISKVQFL